jgi:paraquat-inducible protein B
MNDDSNQSETPQQPDRPKLTKRLSNLPLVWLIPLLALVVGGWLLWRDIMSQGPEITVTFDTAEGLIEGKTPVRYRDVDVGQVTEMTLGEDFEHVVLTIRMNLEFSDYLTDQTRFWVVRPRISARGISGLETIISGAYIEVSPNRSGEKTRKFRGDEEPQYVASGMEGTRYILNAEELGSITPGTPILLRGVEVGEVLDASLNDDADAVTIPIFVLKPYDRLVKKTTRFWDSSGITFDLNAQGVSIRAQSLRSVLAGGINFFTPEENLQDEIAEINTVFRLQRNLKEAETLAHGITQKYILYFDSSVRGLAAGAPVEFNGIRIGVVDSVGLEYVEDNRSFRVPVVITLEPERVQVAGSQRQTAEDYSQTINLLVERGLRARLKTGSFITGQLFVDLGMYPVTPARYLGRGTQKLPELPTLPLQIDEITRSLASLLEKIETFPIEEIGIRLLGTVEGMENFVTSPALTEGMESLNQAATGVARLVNRLDASVLPATRNALETAQAALGGIRDATAPTSPLRYNLEQALKDLGMMARSLRDLAEFLEQNPNALILGKSGPKEDE